MRNFLLFITLSLPVILKAQELTDAGNSWVIGGVNLETVMETTFQIKIDSDTIIQNKVYKTLLQADDAYNPVWHRVNYLLREDDQKIVYILDSAGHEGILYHFGLDVGQQVVLFNDFTVTVISIDSVQVANNEMQKRLKIKASYGPLSWECTSYSYWIEDIGGDLGPAPDSYCLDHDNTYLVGCFTQNDELYYRNSGAGWCEEFNTATIPVIDEAFSIFPNPVVDMLTIQFSDALFQSGNVQLYNSQGQPIYRQSIDKSIQHIDVSQMASGIYFLNLSSGNENLICRKIVKL